ncbi:putative calcium-dependent protein kinase 3-like [Sesbania bispinosa]|nr:putative calcium-dependent protein kinase 3-like [Sesbania bispinosa]
MRNIAQRPASWGHSHLERCPPEPTRYNPRFGRNHSRRHLDERSSAPQPVQPQRHNNVHSNSRGAPHVGVSPRPTPKIPPHSNIRVGSSSLGAPRSQWTKCC